LRPVSSEIGPIELVNCGSEPLKLGLEREVGITELHVWALRHGLMKTHWALDNSTLKWGLLVGQIISLGLTDDLNEMQGVGFDPKGLGYQAQNGSTAMIKHECLEIFGC
jgi:hypothetical protein